MDYKTGKIYSDDQAQSLPPQVKERLVSIPENEVDGLKEKSLEHRLSWLEKFQLKNAEAIAKRTQT